MATLFTVGHSNRPWEKFLDLLRAHAITLLADVRAFPASRRLPHFNRGALEEELPGHGIEYRWMKGLGGRRPPMGQDSPNSGLRVDSFRNYADYMLTPAFQREIDDLLQLAERYRLAIMCAEAVSFRCHRMLISDWLVAHGHLVLHIYGPGAPKAHQLTPEAELQNGQLIYVRRDLFAG